MYKSHRYDNTSPEARSCDAFWLLGRLSQGSFPPKWSDVYSSEVAGAHGSFGTSASSLDGYLWPLIYGSQRRRLCVLEPLPSGYQGCSHSPLSWRGWGWGHQGERARGGDSCLSRSLFSFLSFFHKHSPFLHSFVPRGRNGLAFHTNVFFLFQGLLSQEKGARLTLCQCVRFSLTRCSGLAL